jgi:single-strand DNA-binding protein
MANYNRVILLGNLTKDPELRYTPKGTAIAKLGLAVNRVWTNEAGEKNEEVTFVDVDVFGRTAENCGQYLAKGRPVMVEGRLKLDQWDDKTPGQKRQRLGVVAENIQFIGQRDQRDAGLKSEKTASPATDDPNEVPLSAKPGAPGEPPESDDVPF